MTEVTELVYSENFQKILNWLEMNVHVPLNAYHYHILDIQKSHLKLIELSDDDDKVYFRVLLKATYDDVENIGEIKKNYREINYLTETKSTRTPIAPGPAYQVCIVQLNEDQDPINGILYTYATGEYHKINLKSD